MLSVNIFLDILVLVVAYIYWHFTGHYTPAILGVIFMLLSTSNNLYPISLIMGVITEISIVFFIFYTPAAEEIAISQVTVIGLYMLVIFFKSKNLFYAE